MKYLLLDQLTAWVLVALCWWIIHLSHDVKRTPGLILMQVGLASLAITHMVVATLQLGGIVFVTRSVSNLSIITVLVGVIWFHWKRFGRN